jgi:uncharacterized membrane protein
MKTLVRVITCLVSFLVAHWLAVINSILLVLVGLSLLAPWLMLHGHEQAGRLLYLAFQPLCHQLPERSFFIGGHHWTYGLAELEAFLGYAPPLRYLGAPGLGYKVAMCERDVAIYGGWLLFGLVFALVRHRFRPLPWQGLVALALPMVVDGLLQLSSLAASTPGRRVVTGLLFALGTAWFAYPYIERGMKEARVIVGKDLQAHAIN